MRVDPGLEVAVGEQRPAAKLDRSRTAVTVDEIAQGCAGHAQQAGGVVVVE